MMDGIGKITSDTTQAAKGGAENGKDLVFRAGLAAGDTIKMKNWLEKNCPSGLSGSAKKEAFNFLASNSFNIDMDNPASLKENDAISMLAMMLKTMGYVFEDPPEAETIKENILNYKQFLRGENRISADEMSDAKINIISPDVQKMIILDSIKKDKEIESSRKTSSNKISNADPGASIKILMKLKKNEYEVSGVIIDGDRIAVEDPYLESVDISTAIACFGEQPYRIKFSAQEYINLIIKDLKELKDKSSGEELAVMNKVIDELKGESAYSEKNGLTEIDVRTIYRMLKEMDGKAGYEKARSALLTVHQHLKKDKPGLTADDKNKLELLAGMLGKDGMPEEIDLGKTYTAGTPEQKKILNDGMAVLNRIALDIAAIAGFADKENKTKWEMVKNALWSDLQTSAGKEDLRAVTNGVPQGYMLVLKWGLFQDYVKRLDELNEELFGQNGLIKKGEECKKTINRTETDKMKPLNNILLKINADIEARGYALEEEVEQFNRTRSELLALQNANNKLADEYDKGSGNAITEKLEEYNWRLDYLTNNEIDDKFLARFKERFPEQAEEKFDVKDPYTQAMLKCSVDEALFKGDGRPSFYDRSRAGEKWSTINMVVGEGDRADNVAFAKQVLSAAISSLMLTRENVDALRSGTYLGSMLVQRMGWVSFLIKAGAVALLPDKGRVTVGADSFNELGEEGSIEKYLMTHNLTSGTDGNFNYGLLWKVILSPKEENPFAFLKANLGDDPVRYQNRMNGANLENISKYLNVLYGKLDKAIEDEDGTEKGDYLIGVRKTLKYRDAKALSEALLTLETLKSEIGDGSFELVENIMPLRIYDSKGEQIYTEKTKADKDKLDVINANAETLRKFLIDALAISDAFDKTKIQDAGTAEQQGKPKIAAEEEPVVDAFFSKKVDGKDVPRDINLMYNAGRELAPEKKDFSLSEIVPDLDWSDPYEMIKQSYPYETVKQSLSFKYEMPMYTIPSGFFQTSSLLWKGLTGPKETRKQSWDMGWATGTQTLSSFAYWEYNPLYSFQQGWGAFQKGQYTTAFADWTISVPFSAMAARRTWTFLSEPAKWLMGMQTMTMDEYIAAQGMTLGTPMRIANWTTKMIQRLSLPTQAEVEAKAAKALARNNWRSAHWRYSHLGGMEVEKRAANITRKYAALRANLAGAAESMPKIIRTANIIYNDLLYTRLVDRTFNVLKESLKAITSEIRLGRIGIDEEMAARVAYQIDQAVTPRFTTEIGKSLDAAIKEQLKGGKIKELYDLAKANGMDKSVLEEINSRATEMIRAQIYELESVMSRQFMVPEGKIKGYKQIRINNLLVKVAEAVKSGKNSVQIQQMIGAIFQSREWQDEFKSITKTAGKQVQELINGMFAAAEGEPALAEEMAESIEERIRKTIGLLEKIKKAMPQPGPVDIGGSKLLDRNIVEKLMQLAYEKGKLVEDIVPELEKAGLKIAKGYNAKVREVYQQLCSVDRLEMKAMYNNMVKEGEVFLKKQVAVEKELAKQKELLHKEQIATEKKIAKQNRLLQKEQYAAKMAEEKMIAEQNRILEKKWNMARKAGLKIDKLITTQTAGVAAETKGIAATADLGGMTEAEMTRAGKQMEALLSRIKGLVPELEAKIKAGQELTGLDKTKLVETLTKIDLKDLKDLVKVLNNSKALNALKAFGKFAGIAGTVISVLLSVTARSDDFLSGDYDKVVSAEAGVLKDNTIDAATGLVSITSGFGSGLYSKYVNGESYLENYRNTYSSVGGAMESGLQYMDRFLHVGSIIKTEIKYGNFFLLHQISPPLAYLAEWYYVSSPKNKNKTAENKPAD